MSYGQFNVTQRLDALGEVGNLGFSLKPPAWARSLVKKVISGSTVSATNPISGQPMTVDLSDPAAVKRLKELIASAKLTVGGKPPEPGIVERAAGVVGTIPGGALTIGAAVLALVLLLRKR